MCLKRILLVSTIMLSFATPDAYVWNGYIKNDNGENISYATVKIKTKQNYYMFMSDEEGYVSINYPNYSPSDSIIISHMSYNKTTITNKQLVVLKDIKMTTRNYDIEMVNISPNRTKNIVLGNNRNISKLSSQLTFNQLAVLSIPNNDLSGKLEMVRIKMKNSGEKGWKYRPFRLRLFYPDSIGMGKELIPNGIVASLKATRGNWVEVDISDFKLDFPKEGIYIAVQAMSKDYYLSNGYIDSPYVTNNKKKQTYRRINSISIGTTTQKNIEGVQCWTCVETPNGFTQRQKHPCAEKDIYMFQLIVSPNE